MVRIDFFIKSYFLSIFCRSFKEGRIMNEKLGIYLSLFGVARDGMNLFHINKPVTMDKSWQLQKMGKSFLIFLMKVRVVYETLCIVCKMVFAESFCF